MERALLGQVISYARINFLKRIYITGNSYVLGYIKGFRYTVI